MTETEKEIESNQEDEDKLDHDPCWYSCNAVPTYIYYHCNCMGAGDCPDYDNGKKKIKR